ncbi:hypothetical protein DFH11DRAFT_938381 [Phellopilus nigrolimitatus]|nr:hypothetical protein DFH11DRAFT_938381 [Phellopilus nigrolimitatus]
MLSTRRVCVRIFEINWRRCNVNTWATPARVCTSAAQLTTPTFRFQIKQHISKALIKPNSSTALFSSKAEDYALVDDGTPDDAHYDMDNLVFGALGLSAETRHVTRPEPGLILKVVLGKWPSRPPEIFAEDFLKKNPLLEHKVNEAWEAGSFKNIRRLKILQTRNVEKIGYNRSYTDNPPNAFYKSPYRGNAVEGFEEYLAHNELLFDKASRGGGDRYYAKSFSIIQSSGTGKSRLVHQVR